MYYSPQLDKYILKKNQNFFLFDWDIEIRFFKAVIRVIYLFKSLKNATSCPERVFFLQTQFFEAVFLNERVAVITEV